MSYKAFAFTAVLMFGSASLAATCNPPALSGLSEKQKMEYKVSNMSLFHMVLYQYVRESQAILEKQDAASGPLWQDLQNRLSHLKPISAKYTLSSREGMTVDQQEFLRSPKFYQQLDADISTVEILIKQNGPKASPFVEERLKLLRQMACGNSSDSASQTPTSNGAQ